MKEKFIKKGIKGKLFSVTLAFAMAFLLLPMNKIVANAAPRPLTFTAEEAGSTVEFSWNSGSSVEYSTDGGSTWNSYTANTTISLTNAGDTVSFKGTDVTTDLSNHFTMTGKIAASGDVTSLTNGIGGDVTLSSRCYQGMFGGCTSLVSSPQLPSTALATACYQDMFYGCTNLLIAPDLPATVMKSGCYHRMFYDCANLSKAPKLEVTTLATLCFSYMFSGCTNLIVEETTDASEATWIFPAIVESYWNNYMLNGLTAPDVEAGKMYKVSYVVPLPTPPAAPASSGSSANSYSETIEEAIDQLDAMANRLANGEVIENSTVYFKSGDSLPLNMMQTLKKCPGVTLDFQCTYKGEAYHYALKGGEGLLIDETIPWYGPLYLQYYYGVVN